MKNIQPILKFSLITLLVCVQTAPQVNPCEALGLRFCRLKTDFAQEQGIRQEAITTKRPRFSPTRSRLIPTRAQSQTVSDEIPESSFTREGDTLIVTPSRTVSEEEQAEEQQQTNLRSTLIDRLRNRPKAPAVSNGGTQNDACKGLRFCVLSKNARRNNRPTTKATTTEDPLIESLLQSAVSSANGAPSGGNLINLVLNGDLETAKQLIADGADVNSADQHGNSVLHIAAQNGRGGIIDELIINGADVNKGNNHKNTALHLAAQNGWDEVAAKLLRAKKIDVNFKDLHANTALHLAAQNGQIGVAQQLIEAGANVNAPNAHKHIPLHLAAQNGHLNLSKLLVQSGTDLNYKDLIGNTPLHTAVHNTHTEIAKYLVASGANERAKNSTGLTPFQLVGKRKK